MLAVRVVLTFFMIVGVLTHYTQVMPNYVKKALKLKNEFKPHHRAKIRTISNLTMKQVIDHIKDITLALNYHAKKNGFKVDYRFIVDDNFV